MSFMKLSIFCILLSLSLTPSRANSALDLFAPLEDPANGNLIPEPLLTDYVQANRSPGILVEPYDIVEADGSF